MEQNTRGPRRQLTSDTWIFLAVIGTWALVYALSWLAARLSGSQPTKNVGSALSAAIFDAVHGHGARPWVWVGARRTAGLMPWLLGLSAACLVAGFGVYLFKFGIPVLRPRLASHEDARRRYARYARRGDLGGLVYGRPQHDRLTIGLYDGRLVCAEREASCGVIGPSRSGKTVSQIIPNLLEHHGPALSASVKGDVAERTIGFRSRVGDIGVYDPTNSTGLHNLNWSPLGGIDTFEQASRRAFAMAAGGRTRDSGVQNAEHWQASNAQLLAVMLFAAARGRLGIARVRRWVNTFDHDNDIVRVLEKLRSEGLATTTDLDLAYEQYDGIMKRWESDRSGAFSTAQRFINVFVEPSVQRSTETHDLDIDAFLGGQNTLYLTAPADDQQRVAMLFAGVIESVFRRVFELATLSPGGRLEPTLFAALDEAANIAPLQRMDTYASTGLSQGLKLMVVYQDISQMMTAYTREKAMTILNNLTYLSVLPGLKDVQTMEYLSSLVGKEQYTEQTVSGSNRTLAQREAPLVNPDSWRRLPLGRMRVIYRDRPVMSLQQRRWFEDPRLRAQAELPYIVTARHQQDAQGLAALPRHPTVTGRRMKRWTATRGRA